MPRSDAQEAQDQTLRLTHPSLDFYVDVRLRPYEGGTWLATADLDGEQKVEMSKDPRKAIEKVLAPLGWRRAREMARDAELEGDTDG